MHSRNVSICEKKTMILPPLIFSFSASAQIARLISSLWGRKYWEFQPSEQLIFKGRTKWEEKRAVGKDLSSKAISRKPANNCQILTLILTLQSLPSDNSNEHKECKLSHAVSFVLVQFQEASANLSLKYLRKSNLEYLQNG